MICNTNVVPQCQLTHLNADREHSGKCTDMNHVKFILSLQSNRPVYTCVCVCTCVRVRACILVSVTCGIYAL
jgi:hypothetical protein